MGLHQQAEGLNATAPVLSLPGPLGEGYSLVLVTFDAYATTSRTPLTYSTNAQTLQMFRGDNWAEL